MGYCKNAIGLTFNPIAKMKHGMDKQNKEKDELMQSISDAIIRIQHDKEGSKTKSLSRHNPEKVAKILYLHALGYKQTTTKNI
jgi:hypothetical protein